MRESVSMQEVPLWLLELFLPCLTGEASEYAQIEQTISPEVLSDIISFIKEL
jgi:hypothetical protein